MGRFSILRYFIKLFKTTRHPSLRHSSSCFGQIIYMFQLDYLEKVTGELLVIFHFPILQNHLHPIFHFDKVKRWIENCHTTGLTFGQILVQRDARHQSEGWLEDGWVDFPNQQLDFAKQVDFPKQQNGKSPTIYPSPFLNNLAKTQG